MDKQNKIIMGATLLVVLLVIALAMAGNGTGNNFGGATNSSSTGLYTPDVNFFEGEMPLEKLSQISTCPLTADKNAFAQCLTDKGFVMYGAAWCSHCQAQKALFGDSFKNIKYVECPDNINFCLDKGIKGYPTWIKETK